MQILKSCFTVTTAISILSFCNAEDGFYLRKSVYGQQYGLNAERFSYSGYDTRTSAMKATELQKNSTTYKEHVDSEGFADHENQYVKNIAKEFKNCNYTEKIMATDLWDEFDFLNNFYFYRIVPINIYQKEDLKKIMTKLSNFLKDYTSITVDDKDIHGLTEITDPQRSAQKEALSDAIKVMLPTYFYELTKIATKALLPEFTLKKSTLKTNSDLGIAIRNLVFSYNGDWFNDGYIKSQLDEFFKLNGKYIAPFDLFMCLKSVQKHNGCPVMNWHISRLIQVMHKKGSKYIVDEKKLVNEGRINQDDSFQGNGSMRSVLYPQYKHIYDKVTIYADMHKLQNTGISQKVKFTRQFNDAEFENQSYIGKRCVTACYPNDGGYDTGGGMMGSVNRMSGNSKQNCIFENKILGVSSSFPISSKLAAQNPLLTKDKKFSVGPHVQAIISNDCDLKCKSVIRKNYGVMWSTSGQTAEPLPNEDLRKFIPTFYKKTYDYLNSQRKDVRYAMNLIQSVILAINNEYDTFYLGGLAGCGIWNYFDQNYGAKEVAQLLKPVLIDLSQMLDKANLDILLSDEKGKPRTWKQTLGEAWNELKI